MSSFFSVYLFVCLTFCLSLEESDYFSPSYSLSLALSISPYLAQVSPSLLLFVFGKRNFARRIPGEIWRKPFIWFLCLSLPIRPARGRDERLNNGILVSISRFLRLKKPSTPFEDLCHDYNQGFECFYQ